MNAYTNASFKDCDVFLDANSYESCTFENVVFHYGGGELVFRYNTVGDFTLQIDAPLLQGLENLRAFAHQAGPRTVKKLVDTISGMLRGSGPKQEFVIT